MAKLSFDATAVEPSQPVSSELVPAGIYSVEITASDVKDLKSGNGMGLTLEFTIIDPAAFARRKVWDQLNVQHVNPQAESIARGKLSALCRAVGIGHMEDSDELFGKILRIRTKVRAAEGNYGPKAEVVSYEAAGTAAPTRQAAPARTPAAPPAASAGARPWAR
jgi:hypothetical protein